MATAVAPAFRTFYEFFAGGGMASAGLGRGWKCLFANDFDEMKGQVYSSNWGAGHLRVGDVAAISTSELPDEADLVWASFPCQDLSLAGAGAGLTGSRSGTFWPFWELVRGMKAEGRSPRVVVLENVYGAITSNGGQDIRSIITALASEGYLVGPLVMDASMFLPQSRPRLFVVAVRDDLTVPASLYDTQPSSTWHPDALVKAVAALPPAVGGSVIWWKPPVPRSRAKKLADVIEASPTGVSWHTAAETAQLVAMMSDGNREKVEAAKAESKKTGKMVVGTIYRRTRTEDGKKVQRAEVRFDGTAGCLRTPGGGSSRQIVMIVSGSSVKTRLLSPREAARLMGLPDSYRLPSSYNDAYHVAGDGVAVPVVRHLAKHIAEPVLDAN